MRMVKRLKSSTLRAGECYDEKQRLMKTPVEYLSTCRAYTHYFDRKGSTHRQVRRYMATSHSYKTVSRSWPIPLGSYAPLAISRRPASQHVFTRSFMGSIGLSMWTHVDQLTLTTTQCPMLLMSPAPLLCGAFRHNSITISLTVSRPGLGDMTLNKGRSLPLLLVRFHRHERMTLLRKRCKIIATCVFPPIASE